MSPCRFRVLFFLSFARIIKIYRGSYVIRQIKSLHRYTLLSGIGKAGLTNEDSRSIINRDSSKNRYFHGNS